MAETATQLNAYIDATIATRLSIMESMLQSMTTSETDYKHLQIKELTAEINAAEAKVKRLQQTTRRFRPIRMGTAE